MVQGLAGFSQDMGGSIIQDTASTATLTALLTAREWKYRIQDFKKRVRVGSVYRIICVLSGA
jgi:hypothetical protein